MTQQFPALEKLVVVIMLHNEALKMLLRKELLVVSYSLYVPCHLFFIFYMQYDIYFTIQYDNMIFITLCPHYLLLYEHVNVRFMPFAKLPL